MPVRGRVIKDADAIIRGEIAKLGKMCRGEALVLLMDRRGVRFSSGSACKAGHPDPSHALLAMGLSDEQAHCAVRFSLGASLTDADVDYALGALGEVVHDTLSAIRFVACR